MTRYDRKDSAATSAARRFEGIRITNGPEDLADTINKFTPDTTLGQLSESLKINRILARAAAKKGLKIDFASQVFAQLTSSGITLNTRSASLANRLRQIQPTLAKALFDAGVHAPIVSVKAAKIAVSEENSEDSYPSGTPRIAEAGASEAVNRQAERVIDDELRQALERLAQAIK